MDLGERIVELSDDRKISFDGECYHLRLPLEMMRILKRYLDDVLRVHYDGIWKSGNKFHVILTFGMAELHDDSELEDMESDSDDDYVVLKG